jgi:hypothetical protein
MESIKVIIENWPIGPWHEKFIPLAVGILALIISIASLYFTRKSFRRNSRPFIWANNFASLNEHRLLVNEPKKILFRISNSPAKIINKTIKLLLKTNISNKVLHEHSESNIIQFPDNMSQWDYAISDNEFTNYLRELKNNIVNKGEFERIIEIKYSSIDGGKKYSYNLKQKYDLSTDNWKTYSTSAN